MKLAPVGRVADIAALDLDPIEASVVGYTLNRDEVEETFYFLPIQPAGATLDMIKGTDAAGNPPMGLVMQFLDECVVEGDREAWQAFLHRPDVMIEMSALVLLYQAISEVYAGRPTPRWSDSAGGGSEAQPTSPAAAPSPGSAASKKRNSPKR